MVLKLKRCWFVVCLAVCVKGSCNEHTQYRVGAGMGVGSGDGGAKDTQAVSLRKGGKKKEITVGGEKKKRNRRQRMLMRWKPQKWLSLSQLSSARVVGGKSSHYGAAHRANCADCGGSCVSGGRRLVAGVFTSRSPEELQWWKKNKQEIVVAPVLAVGLKRLEYRAGTEGVGHSHVLQTKQTR